MEDKLSGAIGRVEDQTNSFVSFCAVKGVDLSSLLIEFASELQPKEEYKGFTFNEWHRMAGMMSEKIIELQNFVGTQGKPFSATKELYPRIHALAEKLNRCMSRAVANGKST